MMFQEETRPASWCGTSSSSARRGAFGSRDALMNPTSVSLSNPPLMVTLRILLWESFIFIYTGVLLTSVCVCVCYSTGSLTALVCQHSITPLALPCKLIIPDRGTAEQLHLYVTKL